MEVIPENQSGAIGASPLSPAMVAATEGLDLNMDSTVGFIVGCKEPVRKRRSVDLTFDPGQEKETLDLERGGPIGYVPDLSKWVGNANQALECAEDQPEQEKLDGLNYGDALIHMVNRGHAMARKGWNGKGMFTYYVPAASYPAQTGVAKQFFGEGALVPYNAYMAIKNVNGTVSTWTASIGDQLANDWYVVDLEALKV